MNLFHLSLFTSAGVLIPTLAGAAVRSKANNANDLHLASCWITAAPGPGDVASFDFYPSSQSPRSAMTQDLSWGGISVANTSQLGCRFVPSPGTAYYQLTLGSSGIANNGGTTNNRSVVMNTDLLLAASQTWSGVAGSTVTVAGTYRPAGSYVDLGGNTLTINTIEVSFSGNNPAPYAVRNGTIILNGASLRISSGTRPTGLDPDPICDLPSSLSIQLNAGSVLTPWNNARSSENLQWNANVILNGGTLFASGFQGYFAGSADSTDNTVGGTIQVNATSGIELSQEISFTSFPDRETLHKISAPITGNSSLSFKNSSLTAARNFIVLTGDNSGLLGPVGLNATADSVVSGRIRLASNTAGSPGPWSISAGNTLEIQNSSVTLGYITGPGAVEAVGNAESTLRLNSAGTSTRTFTGTVTQAAGSTLHLRKAGSFTQSISGTPGWNGNTYVDAGKLTLNKAMMGDSSEVHIDPAGILRLSHALVDRVGKLLINGIEQSNGTWGAIGSGADHETASIEGTGFLRVGAPPTAYDAWIEGFAGLSGAAQRGTGADPDGDGADNFSEFAFGGDPSSAGNSGRTAFESNTSLRLIVAIRTGAVFTSAGGEQVSAPVDGIIYRIQSATSPASFPSGQVVPIPSFAAPPGLPALAVGWEYRGFQSNTPVTSEPRQFIRAVAASSF